ncbi:putative membrane protein [Oleiphilus messinensis]|uniref:Putative membrane protein n=1 Tax=Oleiphilus messinensis TaxID=141451 RepID=A0A1Y0I272_9GAMM|nr:DoxX family protein [Oleiphilus messinensis]ARU54309.1 putative membrane protein [Oleiphilus messinensis]
MQIKPNADLAALLLRLTLGSVLLAHSLYLKWVVFTLQGTADYFSSIGLASWLAYVVFAAEVVAGVALLLGVATRWVALGVIPILLGATVVHWGNGWLFTRTGGGWEYPLVLTLMAVIQFYLGSGRLALKPDSGDFIQVEHKSRGQAYDAI